MYTYSKGVNEPRITLPGIKKKKKKIFHNNDHWGQNRDLMTKINKIYKDYHAR